MFPKLLNRSIKFYSTTKPGKGNKLKLLELGCSKIEYRDLDVVHHSNKIFNKTPHCSKFPTCLNNLGMVVDP